MEEIIEYISGEKAYYRHSGVEESEDKCHQSRTGTVDGVMDIGCQTLYYGYGAAIHRQTYCHQYNSEYTHRLFIAACICIVPPFCLWQ